MKKTILAFFLISLSLVISCKKTAGPEGPQGPQGPKGPTSPNGNGTGKIIGNVRQYSQYNVGSDLLSSQYTTGLNQVTVSIDGTTITTVTDTLGNYTLSDVPEGVYDISYIKANAGLSKKQQVIFPGAGTLYVPADSVFDIPTTNFTSGYLKDTLAQGQRIMFLNLQFTTSPKQLYILVIFGRKNNVNINDPNTYDATLLTNSIQNSSYFSSFSYSVIFSNKYPSGTVLYSRIYFISFYKSSYFDYEKNKGVYSNYGTPLAGTFSVVIP